MPTAIINYLAVFVAAIVSMVLGGFWYSPLLFGKRWIEWMNFAPKDLLDMKKRANASYVINFLTLLLMAFVLAHFVDYAQATTFIEGVQAGFWVWLGFIATVSLGSVLWENKSIKVYLINAGYQLVNVVLMGVILTLWK